MRKASFALAAFAVGVLIVVLAGCSNSSDLPSTAAIAMQLSTVVTQGDTTVDVAISAAVDSDGGAVPDGTMVTFETDYGSFAGGGSRVVVATEGGVATATLHVSIPGTAHVSVSVEDVASSVTVQASAENVTISS